MEARVRLRLFHPTVEGGARLEEIVRPLLVNARFAGTINDRAHAIGDFADDRRHRRVVGALRHDDAVAVEQRGGEDAVGVHRLRQSHRRAGGLAEMGQNAPGGGEDLFSVLGAVVDGVQAERVAAADKRVRIFEGAAGPLDGGDEFGRADAAIVVSVNQGGGLGIELQSGDGASQRDPQFLVELIQTHQIGAGFEPHLVETAGAVESPGMSWRSGCHDSVSRLRLEPEGDGRPEFCSRFYVLCVPRGTNAGCRRFCQVPAIPSILLSRLVIWGWL